MLRWVLIILALLLPVGGFMAWRAYELKAPAERVVVAVAPGRADKVDLGAATKHLGQAIQFQTIADPQGEPRDPVEFNNFVDWILLTYPALAEKAKVERVADYSLLYTWAGTDPTSPPVLLIAHLDVAPTDPGARAQWKVEPFGGTLKDGAVWGRGAQLGKSPLVAILEAANALAAGGFKPRRTIILAFGHDGDVRGEKGATEIARVLAARKVKAWFALDEGSPAVGYNTMTGKPAAMIGVTEKRDLDLLVTAAAPGGTSSVRGGPQAVTAVAQAIVALDAMPNTASLSDEPTNGMMHALAPDMPYSRAFIIANAWAFEPLIMMQMRNSPGAEDLISTTVSPTVVSGGDNQALRPSEATATVNVRLHPRDTPDEFLGRARNVVSAFPGVRVEWAEKPGPPIPIASDKSDAYYLIATLAGVVADGATVTPSLYIGSTDARHYTGVAQDVYRFTPSVWTREDIRTVMGANEHLSQKNLGRMIGFYETLLSEAAG